MSASEALEKALGENIVPPESEEVNELPDLRVNIHDMSRLRQLVEEMTRRRIEALRLYEPLSEQENFHKSTARIRLLRGSNRGGKTLPAAVEAARALCGVDPYKKFPKIDGRAFAVGKDLDHVGEVMWRKLARSGAFRVIRDEHTREWRTFCPWREYDSAHSEKSKPAPPLIPPRMIKKVAWESKANNIPSFVTLINGWEISFYSSLGKPPQGADLDFFWLDEEIVDELWFPEMRARILDRSGRGWWSATPQAGSDTLYDLHERAEKETSSDNPKITEHVILLADNRHMSEEEKRDLAADISDDERRVRVGGEFAVESYKVYPSFNMAIHGVESFEIPQTWTRYAVVDPGHQICAVLFAAVPPPEEHDHVYLFNQLYISDCDAMKFADEMQRMVQSQTFQAFVMDMKFALHTEAGSGQSVIEQYSQALQRVNVRSIATGNSFRLASDDVKAGVMKVRSWLSLRECGTPKLKVFRGFLPDLEREIRRYHFIRQGGIVTDRPNQKRNNHLMDALRYLAMYDPIYVKPSMSPGRPQGAYKAFLDWSKKKHKHKPIHLGPGRE